jgi:hypothetical protein
MRSRLSDILEESNFKYKVYHTIIGGATQVRVARDNITDSYIKNKLTKIAYQIEQIAKEFLNRE